MKKYIIIFLIFTISSCSKDNVENQIFEKISINTTESLTDISFINENQGIICGSIGFFAKTNNGGKSWTKLNVGVTQTFMSAFMQNEQNLYTARLGMFSSKNSGNTFSEIGNLSIGSSIFAIKFYNLNQGLILRGGSILKSNDGGNNWTEKYNTNSYSSLNNLQITSPLISYASGGANFDNKNMGEIVKTVDSGQTWTKALNSNSKISSISFISDNIGFYINSNNELYKTINGANNWVKVSNLLYTPLNICFINESIGYFSTYEGQILMTKNGGLSWNIVYNKTNESIVKIISINNTIYAIGNNGLFLKKK